MSVNEEILRKPDLSSRPYDLYLERQLPLSPSIIYSAWTHYLDHWFAAPGSVIMFPKVNTVFFFETEYKPENHTHTERYAHYGRFLNLIPDELIEMTWVTGPSGTMGAETVLRINLIPQENGTLLRLSHCGFPDEESKSGHALAWPMVLKQLEIKYTSF